MESNPYQTPSANLFGSSAATGEAVPSEAIVQLQRTKGWVRFFSVMLWIGVAVFLGLAVIMMFAGTMISAIGNAPGTTLPTGFQTGIMAGVGAFYVILAVFHIYPALKLWSYGSAIAKLTASRQPEDLVFALDQQRAFWKFVGIALIIMILLYILFFVFLGTAIAMESMEALESLPAPEQ